MSWLSKLVHSVESAIPTPVKQIAAALDPITGNTVSALTKTPNYTPANAPMKRMDDYFQFALHKNMDRVNKNPMALVTSYDPLSTKIWDKVLGRKGTEPMVNLLGSPTKQTAQQYYQKGGKGAEGPRFFKIGDTVAGTFAGGALGKAAGLTGAGGALSNISNNTIVVSAGEGAVQGGIGGAIGAESQGTDVGKGALKGAIGGAVSAGTTNALQGGTFRGWQLPEAMQTGTTRVGQGVSTGIGSFAGAEATGANRRDAITSGLASGISTGLFPNKTGATKEQKGLTTFERGIARGGLSALLAASSGKASQPSPAGVSSGSVAQQTSPGSAALAQALRVGDAGAPIFGSTSDEKKRGVWNTESLRNIG